MNEKIDIVITWVDGNDLEWINQKNKYEKLIKGIDVSSNNNARYRDWDNIQFIFRGIEKFMPWVNKVHFVTWGHIPKWLNTDCDKLHVVKHTDFIPEKYLPTFNSNTIELNLHRIPGLAEQFINFNDDMFVIAPTVPEDFFINGIPKDMAVLSPAPCFRDVMCCIETNNFGIINDYFSVDDIKKNWKKWYTHKYGKFILRTIIFSNFKTILGIFEPHITNSFLKSTFKDLWKKENKVLDETSCNKFRTRNDVNQWLFRQWQIMSGNFEPRRWDFGLHIALYKDENTALKLIQKPEKLKIICLNDSNELIDFEKSKIRINAALEKLFPNKSAFEK